MVVHLVVGSAHWEDFGSAWPTDFDVDLLKNPYLPLSFSTCDTPVVVTSFDCIPFSLADHFDNYLYKINVDRDYITNY